MNSRIGIERCLSFINSQLRNEKARNSASGTGRIQAVTISRQAGCGAFVVAQGLAERLQARTPAHEPRWTVFDRNLIERVLEEHNLPKRLAKFLPEDWTSEIQNIIDELFGLHPPSWVLVHQTAETILRLAKLGNVIIIGRGANVVTARLDCVFHVRLVAPFEKRVLHIQEADHIDRNAAIEFIQREDRGRARYLKRHYHKDINDSLLYHLVVNTDLVGYPMASQLIADIVMEKNFKPSGKRSSERILAAA
jgi:cytidylate kinase